MPRLLPNPNDYRIRGSWNIALTIPKNQVRGTATFVIEPFNDPLIEGPESLQVQLRGTSTYTVNPAALTIEDDEQAIINLAARAVRCQPSDNRPNSNNLGEADGKVCYEITGAPPAGKHPSRPVTVRDLNFTGGAASSGTDFTASFPVSGRNNITLSNVDPYPVTAARVDITAVDDPITGEGAETIVIKGRADGYTVRSVAILLIDNDGAPNDFNLWVDADSTLDGYQPSVGEGVSNQTITVTATNAFGRFLTSPTPITISVAAAGGTRGAESNDFTPVTDFTLNFPARMSFHSQTFSLTTADDERVEGDEDLSVSGTASGFTVNGAVLTIDDDDAPPAVALSVDADDAAEGEQSSAGEGSSAQTARVTASVPDGKTFESDLTITVSVDGNGGEGEAEPADFAPVEDFTLTIAAGQSSGSATFSLDPAEDDYVEGAEDITVSGVADLAGVNVTAASVEIADNDAAPSSVVLSIDLDGDEMGDQDEIGEGDAAVSVEVRAELPSGSNTFESATTVSVTVSGEGTAGKAEPSDFSTDKTNNTFDLTIPGGGRSASGTFTLTIADDEVIDVTPETITVSGSTDRSGLTVDADTITIDSDNDSGPTSIGLAVDMDSSTVAQDSGVDEGDVTTVKVTAAFLSGAKLLETDTVVSVRLTADGAATAEANDFSTDQTGDAFDVTIPGGADSGSAVFTLTAADDNLAGEGAETVIVSGTTRAAGVGTVYQASFTIADADLLSVVLEADVDSGSGGRQLDVREGGGPYAGALVRARIMPPPEPDDPTVLFESDATFAVRLTADGAATAEANDFSTDQAGDAFDITIPAGQTYRDGTFTLTVADDAVYEGAETIWVTGSASVPGVTIVDRATSSFINIIDNEARPVISLTVDTDLEVFGDQDYLPEGISNRKVKVTASIPEGSAVRESDTEITLAGETGTAGAGDDFSIAAWGDDGSLQLDLPRGSNRVSGYLSLTTVEDSEAAEGNETFKIGGTAAGYTINPAAVTIDDNDNPTTIYVRVDLDPDEDGNQKTAAEGTTKTAAVTASLPSGSSALSRLPGR